jgi:hypothetical protein
MLRDSLPRSRGRPIDETGRTAAVFEYRTFEVEIVRHVVVGDIRWPVRSESTDESGLGCNRLYVDLHGLSWREAKRVFHVETDLVSRIEQSVDPEAEYDAVEEELYETEDLLGLDLGIASSVAALSAARCIPFTSCNGGTFGGGHAEAYPLVAFFARAQMVELLLRAAAEADAGLENHDDGCLVMYAGSIRNLRSFAAILIRERKAFGAVRIAPQRHRTRGEQLRLGDGSLADQNLDLWQSRAPES